MAGKNFRSAIELQNYLQRLCDQAVKNTAEEARAQLSKYISQESYSDPWDYLEDNFEDNFENNSKFYSDFYKKTYSFLTSAASQLLSNGTAGLFIDGNGMRDENDFSSWQPPGWAGEIKHRTNGKPASVPDFWPAYLEWCNGNLVNLLKKNLKKAGLAIK